MNVFAIIIATVVIADFILHSAAELLNLGSLGRPVPREVADLYGQEMLDRSKQYVRQATLVALVERLILTIAIISFWLLGGFSWLDRLAQLWLSTELARGLAFFALLGLLYEALSVGFDAYRTFALEARFGFNLTSRKTFLADRVKGLLLTGLLGGLLLLCLLLLFLRAGAAAWLLCWCGVVLFSLLLQYLAPSLILPLFNRFEPMPEGELRGAVLRYADSVRYPLQNVCVIDGSRRSTRANAYFTGMGRHRHIALFDTLIADYSIEEIVAILAHEVGHYRLGHITKGLLLSALHAGIALFLLNLVLGRSGLYEAMLVPSASLHVGLVGFALLYVPVQGIISMLTNWLSRRHEYAADRFAVETAPAPWSLVEGLKKLSVVNLAHPSPHWFYVVLNYTHPPLAQRLSRIETLLKEHAVA